MRYQGIPVFPGHQKQRIRVFPEIFSEYAYSLKCIPRKFYGICVFPGYDDRGICVLPITRNCGESTFVVKNNMTVSMY